jgi:uncharacterized membrane protein
LAIVDRPFDSDLFLVLPRKIMKKNAGSLVALVFDDLYKADEARAALLRMAGEHLLEIEESAVIARSEEDAYRITQDTNVVKNKQHVGHIIGIVAAAVTGVMPLIMVATVAGRLFGKFTDDDVSNKFIKEVKSNLEVGTSSLLLFMRTDPQRRAIIVERLAQYQPRILKSDLSPELEKEIDDALVAASAS